MPGFLRAAVCVLLVLVPATRQVCSERLGADDIRALAAGTVPAAAPFVDVHAHLEPDGIQHSIQSALQAMDAENAAKIVFMPPPFTNDDRARYDVETLLPAIQGREDKFLALAGGGTLNAMLHQSVESGDAGPDVRRRFREQAEKLLRDGAAGFGEIAVEHFQGATPYQSAPPDHPLLLLLADVAAEHGVPIDLHMEAIPQATPAPAELKAPPNPPRLPANIAAFERLLRHNRRARIIWAHAGWDNTGYRTPELCRRLLKAHPNLYMDVKIDPLNPGRNSPLDGGGSGALKPEWLQLFQDFSGRFVIGTDQHYPEPSSALQRWHSAVSLLNQLPPGLRRKIGMENAERLYSARIRRTR